MAAEPVPNDSDDFEKYRHLQESAGNLVREAFVERIELRQRIEELQVELEVWKGGHRDAVKKSSSLARELKSVSGGDPIVLCLLDGDGCIFNRHFIAKGKDGGKEAAQKLLHQVTEKAQEDLDLEGRSLQVVCVAFHNRVGLGKVLNELGIATMETYNQFILGFNTAHPLFTLLDVGPSKESADAKFRETLKLYTKISSCRLIYAGCAHDGGYSHLFTSLSTEGLLKDKIQLLKAYDEVSKELRALNLVTVQFDGVFETKKLKVDKDKIYSNTSNRDYIPGYAKPVKMKPSASSLAAAGELSDGMNRKEKRAMVRQQYANGSREDTEKESENDFIPVANAKKGKVAKLNPKKALSRQTPPPCNAFYLHPAKCGRPETCKYGHDYKLDGKTLELLRKDAKKSPCPDLLKGRPCALGEMCYHGHVCPWKSRCRYGNDCRFTAPEMHPLSKDTDSYPSDDEEEDYAEWDFREMRNVL